ncbi:cytochrome b [Halarcobacter bivalviorum]|uniref:cytochrome b n=1 Tax=Halarcobacter bivalviorum TaxID=663364 RepID=UPI00100A2D12|nr:cytochrome b/b6 domain-containing protein [Halarcobacter bivalviorum]RXK03341.1 hypothetical protein CRU97_12520 [Halarcobacter bivalviorum]
MITKYNNSAVFLHWIIGFLLIFLLITGTFVLSEIPNTLEKIGNFRIHMILGILISILSVIRIVNIIKSKKPEDLQMSKLRLKLMKINHVLIYVVVIAIGVSGILLAKSTGLGDIVFFGSNNEIYESFKDYSFGKIHGFLTKVLLFLIATHILGVVSYSIKNKINITKRMWFK